MKGAVLGPPQSSAPKQSLVAEHALIPVHGQIGLHKQPQKQCACPNAKLARDQLLHGDALSLGLPALVPMLADVVRC